MHIAGHKKNYKCHINICPLERGPQIIDVDGSYLINFQNTIHEPKEEVNVHIPFRQRVLNFLLRKNEPIILSKASHSHVHINTMAVVVSNIVRIQGKRRHNTVHVITRDKVVYALYFKTHKQANSYRKRLIDLIGKNDTINHQPSLIWVRDDPDAISRITKIVQRVISKPNISEVLKWRRPDIDTMFQMLLRRRGQHMASSDAVKKFLHSQSIHATSQFISDEDRAIFWTCLVDGILEQSKYNRSDWYLRCDDESFRKILSALTIRFPLTCMQVYQDMTRPFKNYFINSSHNTYIQGPHQWYGSASLETYKYAIKNVGCKCVEVDVWPGLLVCHSNLSLVTPHLKLIDVLKVIGENAFENSPYPLIITIENHADENEVGAVIVQILGDKLFYPPLNNKSPYDLRYKILIRSRIVNENSVLGKITSIVHGINTISVAENQDINLDNIHENNIVRVYPCRSTSTNMDPIPKWAIGIQLVALNVQATNDLALRYNRAFFANNGKCGYVLRDSVAKQSVQRVEVSIITGLNINLIQDVDVVIIYVKDGTKDLKVYNTNRNPMHRWNETFSFKISNPSLCFFSFETGNHVDLTNGIQLNRCREKMYHLSSMTCGYSHVHLRNKGKIFIKFITYDS